MIKILFLSILFVFIGCGDSTDSVADKNPFDIESFNPYTDPGFDKAWHLKVVDQKIAKRNTFSEDSHINIYNAWEITRGAGVKIAVIDYDFNSKNADLASNVIATYDVETDSTNVIKNEDPHGTACASIIASPKNGIGIIGVAPEAKLILIDANISDDTQRIKAFKKAKELGANIISCSWGFGITHGISQAFKDTIKEMYTSNITVIFSSGNHGIDLDNGYEDESELPWVIGVGASTEYNTKADYSNYGDNIDILAPGGASNSGLYCINNYEDSAYGYFGGTSAAAPVIAGVAALILSINQKLTPSEIRYILISTADKIEPNIANYDPITGFSHTHAYGKVNASAAVAKALNY